MTVKAIVTADHAQKTATLSFIDEYGNSAKDSQGNGLKSIAFPYKKIMQAKHLFKSISKVENSIEEFEFGVTSFR